MDPVGRRRHAPRCGRSATPTRRDSARVARLIRRADPDRILYLGDVYPNGSRDDFDRWAKPWGGSSGGWRRRPATTSGPRRDEGYEPFWREVTGETPPTYYSFNAGGWEILSVNGEHSESALGRELAQRAGELRRQLPDRVLAPAALQRGQARGRRRPRAGVLEGARGRRADRRQRPRPQHAADARARRDRRVHRGRGRAPPAQRRRGRPAARVRRRRPLTARCGSTSRRAWPAGASSRPAARVLDQGSLRCHA